MKVIIAIFVTLFFSSSVWAQSQMNKASDSDPKAKKILDALKKEYNSYKSLEVAFELEIELPGKGKEIQKGKLIQSGKKFMAALTDQDIYCDGKTVWLHLKSNKEVQINNFEENASNEMMMSPSEMLRLYESGKYAYAITGNAVENGTNVTLIEFKPLDKKSQYSKLRLSVDTKKNKTISMKVFSKDGSRYTLLVKSILPNKAYTSDVFVYNPKKHPGVRVEDLRID
jgi:outer membrane lipoprotein carrier protein